VKRLFAATLLLFFLEGSNQIISAQTDAAEVKSLRGLQGVDVLIESLPSDAKKAGVTKRQLRIEVEVELRKAGISVLTEDESLNAPGMSYLYVHVNAVALTESLEGSYIFSVRVELKQYVYLGRDRSIGTTAITWQRGAVGTVGTDNFRKSVRETVRDYVNEFINDYLTVNPK